MPFVGEFGLEYRDKREESYFKRTRRLNGFHVQVVKKYFEEEVYSHLLGSNWNNPEPQGRGGMGNWGFDLRYACLDHWYRDAAIEKGRFTRDEVDNFWAAWKGKCSIKKSLSNAELLHFWHENRKDRDEAKATNARKRVKRKSKAWELRFQAERDPSAVYRRLKATLPITSTMDEQLLRSFARMLSEANDVLWQAEQIKEGTEVVPLELLPDYTKLLDLNHKIHKQVGDLLKAHGYDYQARRSRRETQTAAEVFDDFVDQAAVLFDQRAIEMICKGCNLSLAYFVRQFPTVEFTLSSLCPRCDNPVTVVMEALDDEVMDG